MDQYIENDLVSFLHRSHQLRAGRYSEKNRIYLLTTCCNDRQPVFLDQVSARLVIREAMASDCTGATRTFAYVVMPDHLHWLFQLQDDSTLDHVMRRVKGRSARAINFQLNRQVPVWQPGFHDRALRQDESVEIAANYVVHNPVRAGICKTPGDYPFSGIVGENRDIWAAIRDRG